MIPHAVTQLQAFGAALRKEDVNMSLDALRRTAHDPLYWELARPFYRIAHRSYPALSMVRDP